MADIADVLDALYQIAFATCYPAGSGQPSITTRTINIAEGWPLTEDMNKAAANGTSLVALYLLPGTAQALPQVMDWGCEVVDAPNVGLSASVSDDTATLSGAANAAGEYATLSVNKGFVYSYQAPSEGFTAAQMAAQLLSMMAGDFPDATCDGAVLTISSAFSIVPRIGGQGTLGRKIHRQAILFDVIVWAPSPADRTTIGRALDVAMKTPVRLTMPDTSTALIKPRDVRLSDREENKGLYRRDLILSVEFDTIELIEAYEVTSIQVTSEFGGRSKEAITTKT